MRAVDPETFELPGANASNRPVYPHPVRSIFGGRTSSTPSTSSRCSAGRGPLTVSPSAPPMTGALITESCNPGPLVGDAIVSQGAGERGPLTQRVDRCRKVCETTEAAANRRSCTTGIRCRLSARRARASPRLRPARGLITSTASDGSGGLAEDRVTQLGSIRSFRNPDRVALPTAAPNTPPPVRPLDNAPQVNSRVSDTGSERQQRGPASGSARVAATANANANADAQ